MADNPTPKQGRRGLFGSRKAKHGGAGRSKNASQSGGPDSSPTNEQGGFKQPPMLALPSRKEFTRPQPRLATFTPSSSKKASSSPLLGRYFSKTETPEPTHKNAGDTKVEEDDEARREIIVVKTFNWKGPEETSRQRVTLDEEQTASWLKNKVASHNTNGRSTASLMEAVKPKIVMEEPEEEVVEVKPKILFQDPAFGDDTTVSTKSLAPLVEDSNIFSDMLSFFSTSSPEQATSGENDETVGDNQESFLTHEATAAVDDNITNPVTNESAPSWFDTLFSTATCDRPEKEIQQLYAAKKTNNTKNREKNSKSVQRNEILDESIPAATTNENSVAVPEEQQSTFTSAVEKANPQGEENETKKASRDSGRGWVFKISLSTRKTGKMGKVSKNDMKSDTNRKQEPSKAAQVCDTPVASEVPLSHKTSTGTLGAYRMNDAEPAWVERLACVIEGLPGMCSDESCGSLSTEPSSYASNSDDDSSLSEMSEGAASAVTTGDEASMENPVVETTEPLPVDNRLYYF